MAYRDCTSFTPLTTISSDRSVNDSTPVNTGISRLVDFQHVRRLSIFRRYQSNSCHNDKGAPGRRALCSKAPIVRSLFKEYQIAKVKVDIFRTFYFPSSQSLASIRSLSPS